MRCSTFIQSRTGTNADARQGGFRGTERPPLYARPNDRGACTESELRNSFSQPKGKKPPKVPASEPRDWEKQQSEIFTCAVMGVVIFGGTMMSVPHAGVIALFLTTISFGIWFLLPRSLRNVISQFFTRR